MAGGGEAVPLTDYQADLARLLSENRTFDSYLASGGAILIEPNTNRFSRALVKPIDPQAVKREWLEALDSEEPFVESRSPEEFGCLYYSASRRKFVDPREVTDAEPHFGRPGGVLPRILED